MGAAPLRRELERITTDLVGDRFEEQIVAIAGLRAKFPNGRNPDIPRAEITLGRSPLGRCCEAGPEHTVGPHASGAAPPSSGFAVMTSACHPSATGPPARS